ncbi:MAG: endonuclease MutS2, partial [Clostridia bacterium]|nr:endonuclease MutS2 [Clostridia bacterium]
MDERNLRVLEYNKILEMLSQRAVSQPGKEAALALTPSGEYESVESMQEQTEEANTVRAYTGQSPIIYFTDVKPHVHKAGAGGTLSPRALLEVAQMLNASRVIRQALTARAEEAPNLSGIASALAVDRSTEEEIFNAILSEDEISDRASPELYDIRRHIRILNDKMRDKLNQMTKNPSLAKYLQDTIITMRNGRYVVPVKAECRQYVDGLVHDQSASGQTLYIEPLAVVEAGNDLKQWLGRERAEIERILSELSGRLAPYSESYEANVTILSELDVIFAKAQLGRDMKA